MKTEVVLKYAIIVCMFNNFSRLMKTEVVLKCKYANSYNNKCLCLMKTEVVLKYSTIWLSSLYAIPFNENRSCIEID